MSILKRAEVIIGRSSLGHALSGTILAQGALLLATPFLTRIYSPDALGNYFTALAVCLIVSSISTLRLDVAIQRNEPGDVRATVGAALLSGIGVALFASTIGVLAQPLVPQIPYLGGFVGLYCIVMTVQQVVVALLLRNEFHSSISRNRAASNIFIVILQLISASIGSDAATLLVADAIGRLGALLLVVPIALKLVGPPIIGWRTLVTVWRREWDLLRFSTPATLLNNATVYALPVSLALAYPAGIIGQVAMTQKLVSLPLAVIGQALGQVYLGGAIKQLRNANTEAYTHFLKFTRLLAVMALVLIAFIPFAPYLFGKVLGEHWTDAGQYYQILAVAYAAQFIVNPVSQTLNLHSAERLQLIWDIVRFFGITMILLGGPAIGLRIESLLAMYAAAMTIAYLVLLFLSAQVTRYAPKRLI